MQILAISYTPLVNMFVAIPHCGRTMVVTSTERHAFDGRGGTLNRLAGMRSRIFSINVDRKGPFWDIMEGIGIGMGGTIRWLLVPGAVKDRKINKAIAYQKSISQSYLTTDGQHLGGGGGLFLSLTSLRYTS